jgi:hypothetical protein
MRLANDVTGDRRSSQTQALFRLAITKQVVSMPAAARSHQLALRRQGQVPQPELIRHDQRMNADLPTWKLAADRVGRIIPREFDYLHDESVDKTVRS